MLLSARFLPDLFFIVVSARGIRQNTVVTYSYFTVCSAGLSMLTKIYHSNGPRIEPCGAPIVVGLVADELCGERVFYFMCIRIRNNLPEGLRNSSTVEMLWYGMVCGEVIYNTMSDSRFHHLFCDFAQMI